VTMDDALVDDADGAPDDADAALDDAALDGNAIAGLLASVFGADMTMAVGTCGSCGAVSLVAELVVYLTEIGAVVRCRSCESVLMVFVSAREVVCVDLMGLASLS
jgi:Family of unknown function (DUF6510)